MKTKRLMGLSNNLSMRLCVFLIYGFMMVAVPSQAAKIHFGLQASPELAWIKPNFTNARYDGLTFGYKYGLYAAYDITDHYAFATGVQISNRGGKFTYNDTLGVTSTDIRQRIQYLDIPLNLKMTTNEIGYITYYGEFGLLPSVRLKARSDVEPFVAGVSLGKTENINSVNEINPVNLALHLGIGMQYSVTESTSFLVGAYFNNGFTDMLHDTKPMELKANGNQVGLSVGVLF
jgi:hypothetical protein